MADDDKKNKTEKPTGHKLKKAKEKGQVPRSREMNHALNLLFITIFMAITISAYGDTFIKVIKKYFSFGAIGDFNSTDLSIIQIDSFKNYLKLMVPFFLIITGSGFISHVAQGGFKIVSENLKIKFSKLNPVTGIKKVLGSLESVIEIIKSLLKVGVMGIITYAIIRANFEDILGSLKTDIKSILALMGSLLFKVSMSITIFLLILAVIDYFIQKFQHTKKLKMSKDDIKQEYKMLEGDPLIKGKRRQIMLQRAMARMMQEIPNADVVITNPDHFALAIQYDNKKMNAPKLIAKGKNLIAERIKKIAKENDIPLVENPKLARAIYKMVNLNDFIPENFFKPVAEILAYIYKLKNRKSV